MRLRSRTAAIFVLAATVAAPPLAVAQSTPASGGVNADGVTVDPNASTATLPPAADGNGAPPASADGTGTTSGDDAQPITPPTAATTPVVPAGGEVLQPPPYLTPGQYASVQPVSGVARLKDPDVPLEPVRIAALIAMLLAAAAVGSAVVMRSLGLRTAAASPVRTGGGGRLTRIRDRMVLVADDFRDFLRHSR